MKALRFIFTAANRPELIDFNQIMAKIYVLIAANASNGPFPLLET